MVELTIVMAITAIICVMIVSFSTLISAQTKKNNLRADFLESVIALRSDLQKEFAKVDNGNITVSSDGENIENPEFSFSLENYEYIDTITFDTQGDILKVVVSNETLGEEQSFILISKVNTSSTASGPPSPTGEG